MNIISQVLRNKKSNCALIPFITAGYPDKETSIKALHMLDKQGADIIELGVPYSDALADGFVIQQSSKIALENGIYIDQVLSILMEVSSSLNAPIIIFTYYNPILVRGIRKFIREISLFGAKGLIIPDLPLEESDYIIELCLNFNIELILFIAPNSSDERIQAIISKSPGCIYVVSSYGVTGTRSSINNQINLLINKIKENSDKNIMLGFGISNCQQVALLSKWNIDGIVVGSAFINAISGKSTSSAIKHLGSFCNQLKLSIDIL